MIALDYIEFQNIQKEKQVILTCVFKTNYLITYRNKK